MNEQKFERYVLIAIVVLAVALRLLFAFSYHEIWWDSGVYVGMGKYLASGGSAGLWEHIRPPFVPLLLGGLWFVGLDPVIFGRLFEILLMGAVVLLTYLVGKEWFGSRSALLASLLIALSPIFFHLSFHQYTEIPSVFFVLLSLFFIQRNHAVLSGAAVGLAFLAKFPAGLFFVIIAGFCLYLRKWRDAFKVAGGFALLVLPYLAASAFVYGSPLATLKAGQSAISLALGCNVLRYHPWWYYFVWLLGETKMHLFALPGVYFLMKSWKQKHVLFAASLIIPLAYFLQLHCRDYRYVTLFLPFVALLAAFGAISLLELKWKKWSAFVILLVVCGLWAGNTMLNFYEANEVLVPDPVLEEYLRIADSLNVSGEVWVSHPSIAAHTNRLLEKMYYPIYNEGLALDFSTYIKTRTDKIGAVFLDNCGGGIICPPNDSACEAQSSEMIGQLDARFTRVFDKNSGRCWYRVWVQNVTS